ncbi:MULTISPECIES: chemotaxis protein CheB [Buttiauxella]|jgi:two-component system chemotaxis response regulator CheB|uniref:chemotaxis protein CheB n=1 Tax=Buttiauxella TaxID=82976 RepID=UPI000EF81E98|nr:MULTISPECIES: chemotaxis protein CheB [Buttiauxella]AYN29040.1 protein-glutamate methylesterase [Buttiauxella sp. 3AFRM03]MCE0827388.1 protein-glutamate methylesterase [Buttiauxella ferragutiae]UNK62151.1 protein-glutamate methylesterase [Buttiauxella ferragutiae]
MTLPKIRVLIVDHGSESRDSLIRQLEMNKNIVVVGQAVQREQAASLVQKMAPNLLVLTLGAPDSENVETVETIMATCAIPIMVMRYYADAQWDTEYITRGALAVVDNQGESLQATQALHRQVEMLVGVKVIRHIQGLRHHAEPPTKPASVTEAPHHQWPFVLAIACSTGGPQALSKLLQALPAVFPCPIIIAQHIADGFAKSMVQWLDSVTELEVRLAGENDILTAGRVYILPPEHHLVVKKHHRLATIPRKTSDVYHPSCNLLLESVAEVYGEKSVGLIMTGMGSDGCRGIEAIFHKGGKTLAQDEVTSVVFGMNKFAIDKNVIHKILPLEKLAGALLAMAHQGKFEGKLP